MRVGELPSRRLGETKPLWTVGRPGWRGAVQGRLRERGRSSGLRRDPGAGHRHDGSVSRVAVAAVVVDGELVCDVLVHVDGLVHVRVVPEVRSGLRRSFMPAIRRCHCPAHLEQQRERKEEREGATHGASIGELTKGVGAYGYGAASDLFQFDTGAT